MPRRRSRVVKSNRNQILLFSILTLVLTAVVVWGGRTWLRNSETLVFAVGEANGPEARFADRLAAVLKNNSSRLRLKIVPNGDNAKASDGLDTFKLGYEFVRDEIGLRREHLKRHPDRAERVKSDQVQARSRPRPDLGDLALERGLPRVGQRGGARLGHRVSEIGQRQHAIEGRLDEAVDDRIPVR